MRRLAYLAPLAMFVPAFLAMWMGGLWTWSLPILSFVCIPLVDQSYVGTHRNLAPEEEAEALSTRAFDLMIWTVVPLQLTLLTAFVWRMGQPLGAPWEIVGTVFTMGIACGVYGINVGHELGHRRAKGEQILAKILLSTSLYAHFFVEHNRDHHRRVATHDDPASARRGESVYAFWYRSVVGSWRSAWELENRRLERQDVVWWAWQNEMVRLTLGQLALVGFITLVGGVLPTLGFLAAAVFGFLLLETVNYVEHYGLVRNLNARGVPERVRPHHSWTSDRPGGRVFLFELTRHADHHAHSTRPYQVLRHFDDAPELPAGYPAMILLALVPPLFRAVMEPELEAWSERFASVSGAA